MKRETLVLSGLAMLILTPLFTRTPPTIGSSSKEKSKQDIAVVAAKEASGILPNSTTKEDAPNTRVQFVPYPHKRTPIDEDAICNWQTFTMTQQAEKHFMIAGDEYDEQSAQTLDSVQLAALEEGICVPQKKAHDSSKIRVFSSKQARKCLSLIHI